MTEPSSGPVHDVNGDELAPSIDVITTHRNAT